MSQQFLKEAWYEAQFHLFVPPAGDTDIIFQSSALLSHGWKFLWFPTPPCSFSVAKDSILLQQFGGNYIEILLFIIKTFFYNSSIYCASLQGC